MWSLLETRLYYHTIQGPLLRVKAKCRLTQTGQADMLVPCMPVRIAWAVEMYHQRRSLRMWDGVVVKALASHQCGLGSILAWCHTCRWLGLLLVLFLHRGFSPCTPVFLSPEKPTFPNSNSPPKEEPHENQLRLMWLPLEIL